MLELSAWVGEVIRALQVGRYVWKIYVVDDDGKVDIWNYRGEVQTRDGSLFYSFKATFPPIGEPRLEPWDIQFRTLAEAAEAIA